MKAIVGHVIDDDRSPLIHGLRRIRRSWPSLIINYDNKTTVTTIVGTSKEYLDQVIYEFVGEASRRIEISLPFVSLRETVGTSRSSCSQISYVGNQLQFDVEPLHERLAQNIENGVMNTRKGIAEFMRTNQNDFLGGNGFWTFGPGVQGTNLLMDRTAAYEMSSLPSILRDNVVQGFEACTRQGPICEEPIRNVNFVLINAQISHPAATTTNQILKLAQHEATSSFLATNPRLMEPIYVIEIQAPKANISEIKRQISLRRGEILRIPERETIVNIREKVNYSPQREIFVVIKAYLPAKELAKLFSIGLKKFRTWKYQYVFDHWAVVPGYPLEEGHPSSALNFRTEMKNIKVLLKQ